MQLGLVGLGRMGFNMRERLRKGGHDVVGYDRNPDVTDASSLADLEGRVQLLVLRRRHLGVGVR
ncbi:NAD(P)-binding domain-containing protein, partial [Kibdelosporangium lantanae]